MSTVDLDAIRARVERAHDEVCGLADGSREWRMRIPAQPERDSDLVISAVLADAEVLLAEVRRLRRELAAVEDSEDARLAIAEREVQRLRAAASEPRYVPVMRGVDAGMVTGWMHECGYIDWWPTSGPTDGGCDACESGSNNAADWRLLFESAATQPEVTG